MKKCSSSKKVVEYTDSSRKFEESPQSKLSYNIGEDLSKVKNVYGGKIKP